MRAGKLPVRLPAHDSTLSGDTDLGDRWEPAQQKAEQGYKNFTRALWRAGSYSPSSLTFTFFTSAISEITIARIPFRSNAIPVARTYFPTNGISFSR